jgi:hypothetical protein
MSVFGKVFIVIATLAGLCFVANLISIITRNHDRPVAARIVTGLVLDPSSNKPSGEPSLAPEMAPPLPTRLTELRGRLARRREYDLWLITNVSNILGSEPQMKIMDYCMVTVHGAEQSLDSAPAVEYALQPDGTVLRTSGEPPPKTPEQRFREGQRKQLDLEVAGTVVQDCAASLLWFRTWHNQPMSSDGELREQSANAKADLAAIDGTLNPRLAESLPKPHSDQPPQQAPAIPPAPSEPNPQPSTEKP